MGDMRVLEAEALCIPTAFCLHCRLIPAAGEGCNCVPYDRFTQFKNILGIHPMGLSAPWENFIETIAFHPVKKCEV